MHCKLLGYVFKAFIISKVSTPIHFVWRRVLWKMWLFIIPLKSTLSGIQVAIATKSLVDSSSRLNPRKLFGTDYSEPCEIRLLVSEEQWTGRLIRSLILCDFSIPASWVWLIQGLVVSLPWKLSDCYKWGPLLTALTFSLTAGFCRPQSPWNPGLMSRALFICARPHL